MIRVRKLYKRFGFFEALRYIDFDVESGETVGLLGENGAGKTTTMRILACFFPPTSGLVVVDGHEAVLESAALRRSIGYLPESVPLYGNLRVVEFLRYRGRLKGLSGNGLKQAVERVLGIVQLGDRRRSLIQDLSKGLRQRVGLADALVHDPKVLILDEPTSGLDPSQRREVREAIKSLEGRHTVLVSSHILPEIEATCRRAIVIHAGQVVASQSIQDLKRMAGGERFVVTVRATSAALEAALANLPGLRMAPLPNAPDGLAGVSIAGDEGPESRQRVVERLIGAGISIHELKSVDESLEVAFLRLIGKEAAE